MMNGYPYASPIRSGAISPVLCFQQGWALIRDRYWLFFGIVFVAGLLSGFTCGILGGAMTCGIALCFLAKARNQYLDFNLLFKGFDYFSASFIIVIIWIAMYFLTAIPNITFSIATSPLLGPENAKLATNPGVLATGYGIQLVTTVVQQVLTDLMTFACLLIVDRRMTGIDATKTSFRALFANIGGFAGLVALCVLVSIGGLLACVVGVLFVTPIIHAAVVAAYFQVFPDTEMPIYPPEAPPPSPYRPPYA
jgi:hypothetical protein